MHRGRSVVLSLAALAAASLVLIVADRMSGNGKEHRAVPETPKYAVIVELKLSDDGFGVRGERDIFDGLEDDLIRVIGEQDAGEFDGTGTGMGFHSLYMYGPSAERLLEVTLPVIRAAGVPPGSYVRWDIDVGGATEERLDL